MRCRVFNSKRSDRTADRWTDSYQTYKLTNRQTGHTNIETQQQTDKTKNFTYTLPYKVLTQKVTIFVISKPSLTADLKSSNF